eukprot:UN04765
MSAVCCDQINMKLHDLKKTVEWQKINKIIDNIEFVAVRTSVLIIYIKLTDMT